MSSARLPILLLVTLFLALAGRAQAADTAFGKWAAIVIAGDWRGSGGGATEAFDNARHDVSAELVRLGFSPARLLQYSVRPERYAKDRPAKSDIKAIFEGLASLTSRGPEGCLVYLTSHGAPQGVVVDAVISACFSGVFVPDLSAPNRMVLTAARPDRTSFGCGESNRYPFFDECFLQSAPSARNFASLAGQIRVCVAEREIKEGIRPPSEPQLFIGPQLRPVLPLYAFPVRAPPP